MGGLELHHHDTADAKVVITVTSGRERLVHSRLCRANYNTYGIKMEFILFDSMRQALTSVLHCNIVKGKSCKIGAVISNSFENGAVKVIRTG
jgi:hypothetical protein